MVRKGRKMGCLSRLEDGTDQAGVKPGKTQRQGNQLIGARRDVECYRPGRIARVICDDGSAVDYCQNRAEFLKGEDAKPGQLGDVL